MFVRSKATKGKTVSMQEKWSLLISSVICLTAMRVWIWSRFMCHSVATRSAYVFISVHRENMQEKSGKERKKEMNEENNSNKSVCQNQSVDIANLVWKAHTHTHSTFVRMRRFGRKYLKRKLLSLEPTIVQRQTNKQKL